MEQHTFRFKQFSVRHDRCAMKVGTDGVLLGAWCTVVDCKSLLDIGSGSGLIALMLAQRTPPDAIIDAVEISATDHFQAKENGEASPWKQKINFHNVAIQDYKPDKYYDLIVSNPPFFINSSLPPLAERQRARHTGELDFNTLLNAAVRLLSSQGRFSIILPTAEGIQFREMAMKRGLFVVRETAFYSREGKLQERWLFEFAKTSVFTPGISDSLLLYKSEDTWSAEYRDLVSGFYL